MFAFFEMKSRVIIMSRTNVMHVVFLTLASTGFLISSPESRVLDASPGAGRAGRFDGDDRGKGRGKGPP